MRKVFNLFLETILATSMHLRLYLNSILMENFLMLEFKMNLFLLIEELW